MNYGGILVTMPFLLRKERMLLILCQRNQGNLFENPLSIKPLHFSKDYLELPRLKMASISTGGLFDMSSWKIYFILFLTSAELSMM